MGGYCKAYLVKDFRAFPGWAGQAPDGLADDAVLYLQENLVVTDGIFIDEDVVFGEVTPEWEAFCRDTLGFSVPDAEVPAGGALSEPA